MHHLLLQQAVIVTQRLQENPSADLQARRNLLAEQLEPTIPPQVVPLYSQAKAQALRASSLELSARTLTPHRLDPQAPAQQILGLRHSNRLLRALNANSQFREV